MSNDIQKELRFEFGANWQSYLDHNLSPERIDQARQHLLSFIGREDLLGLRILDIGSGSGIHSMAAFQAGAAEVVSFDYDAESVMATKRLHAMCHSPENWRIMQGSVLDPEFMNSLGQFDLVYAWGVLHHTGAVWTAIDLASTCVKPGGLMYIALYDSDWSAESPEFWCDIKQRYTASSAMVRRMYEAWYVARFVLRYNPFRLGYLFRYAREYKKNRGMDFYHDVKDWLGGWPMEYTRIYEVIPFLQTKGMRLLHTKIGELNTEYLFSSHKKQEDLSHFSELKIPNEVKWNVVSIRDEKDLSALDLTRSTFIYGAGKGGSLVKEMLNNINIKPEAFITTTASQSEIHDGLMVLSLENFMENYVDNIQVIIASGSFDYISFELVNHGITNFFNAYPYVLSRL
ncbi:class I SAM-dependent methyltransferase [Aeromonas hydrophila]|uniref:class I SAM-dependent methyltransferase n=1 Tax=Aeromonas hydrophila TaxID=644 RepID=UPI00207D0A27|nr:class I SAM-dependent methyltransferase [Aeromonas hydrophila]MCO4213681.1 class I SAM-dependent methyltransferase [Aeromonas hydrophila]HDX8443374.1 class I SAM-dependent methyltransferase [Aeromonas hydrophila]HDX8634381.1 class I SAM-dependent methyltransferase [Aeromonas hydrophila]